ncbi:MAG: hypothetical protein J0L97_04160 [Alphaproteobacteria bacterium]|nr:hypothetical protein [Alphaproteobacteria bacterium]
MQQNEILFNDLRVAAARSESMELLHGVLIETPELSASAYAELRRGRVVR